MKTWWNLNNPYWYRNDNLLKMGFKTYRAYLRSELWKFIREQVLSAANYRCKVCGEKAIQVHHRAYDPATLRGESLNSLTAVCKRCHDRAERQPAKVGDHLGQMTYQRLQRANKSVLKKRKWPKKFRHKPKVAS